MNNNEPLVLGKIKRGKTGKPLVVLIIFLFAGAIIFFLPSMAEYFSGYNIIDLIKNGEFINFFINHDNYVDKNVVVTTTTNKIIIEESKIINSKTVLEYNNFTLSNFILNRDNITYKITTSNTINFDESNYYLILEKDNKKIYIKLSGEVNKELTSSFKFSNVLNDTIEVKGYIKPISDKEYPDFTLSSDETGTASLICKKDYDSYEYMFSNNSLVKVKQTYIYNDDNNYFNIFEKFTNLSNKININGGISSIEETYDGFIFKTDIDLILYQEKINYNYYSLNTKSNKINFEMKAKGFDCR